MDTHQVTVEQILYGSYIKYEKLRDITMQVFKESSANHVNIYIDMYDLLLPIYRDDVVIQNYTVITSSIINLCAHLRTYFRTRHGVTTKIFIVYSKCNSYTNTQFIKEYNEYNINKIKVFPKINELIDANIELLELLCKYLNDIYFIYNETSFEPAVIMHNLICLEEVNSNCNPNIIISKSPYNYQLASINKNNIIYRPRKSNGEDLSYFVNNSNMLIRYILDTRTVKSIDKYKEAFNLHPQLFSAILALSGLKCRNIKSIINLSTAINRVSYCIKNNMILNEYTWDYRYLYTILNYDTKLPISDIGFEHRLKAIDLIFQHSLYMQTPDCSRNALYSTLNLVDNEALKSINDKYFRDNPLDLINL